MRPRLAIALRVALAAAGLGAVAIAGSVVYLVHQATALPDWYDPEAPAPTPIAEDAPLRWVDARETVPLAPPRAAGAGSGPAATPPSADGEAASEARPRRAVMRDFHVRAMAKDPVLHRATRSSRAEFDDGHLEAGAILDLDRLDRAALDEESRRLLDRATRAYPALRQRKVYIALEDEPVTRDGFLQLGPNPRIRIGNLSHDLERTARKLGLSPARLRRDIDAELRRLEVRDPALTAPEDDDPGLEGPI